MTDCPAPLMLALTTEADEAKAELLASRLLERRLVACVSLAPIRSLYLWRDAVQNEHEVQLLLKTTPDQLERLQRAVMELHSYDTPEWLVWRADASPAYGSWAQELFNTDGPKPDPEAAPASEPPAG